MTVISNPLLLKKKAAAGGSDYQIEKSLRFNSGDDPYLLNTPGTSGNLRTYTYSFWFKTCVNKTNNQYIFTTSTGGSPSFVRLLASNDTYSNQIQVVDDTMGWGRILQPKIRDHAAWRHLVVSVDSTNWSTSVGEGRVKIYLNGELLTSFDGTSNVPSQNAEGIFNKTAEPIYIGGQNTTDNHFDGYISDFQMVDGLALSPAAFGKFDTANCWQPKAFALPTPNDGTNWSNLGGGTEESNYPWERCFTGATNPGDGLPNTAASEGNQITFVPNKDITADHEILISLWTSIPGGEFVDDDCLIINGENHGIRARAGMVHNTWKYYSVPSRKIDSTNGIVIKNKSANNRFQIDHILVDGVCLQDSITDPETRNNVNDGRTWSSTVADGFNGNLGDNYLTTSSDTITVTFSPGIPYNELRFASSSGAGMDTADMQYSINGGTLTSFKGGGFENAVSASGSNTLTSFAMKNTTATNCRWNYLKVDGHHLINGIVDNSYHLKFNDLSRNSALGKDTFNGAVNKTGAAPTGEGAYPFYDTTDDYGEVKGSGTRTDSDSGNLVFAMPGTTLTDVSTSPHSMTNSGVTVSTAESRFYGSSLYFNGDHLSAPYHADFLQGYSGNFTIEAWVKTTASSKCIMAVWDGGNSKKSWNMYITANGPVLLISTDGSAQPSYAQSSVKCNTGIWCHVAFVRNSNTVKCYIDGVETGSTAFSGTIYDTTNSIFAIGATNGTAEHFDGYIQDARIYKAAKYTANFTPPTRNDFTVNNLAHDTGGTPVSSATGAKPILTATDSFGTTTGGSVDTTDSAKASIKLALPFQDDTDDVHHTVKGDGSSARAVSTVNAAYTTNAKYYGGAGDFTATTNQFSNEVSNTDGHFDVGTGNVTIEWWAYYPSTVSSNGYIFYANATNGDSCYAYAHSNGMVAVKFAGFTWQAWPNDGSGGHEDFENGVWNHFCIMRSGSTWTAYMNGVAKRTTTNAVDFNPGDTIGVGNWGNSSLTYHAKCYLQDFRWYHTAKYSGNFTPPAAPTTAEIAGLDSVTDTPTNYGTDERAGAEVRGNYCTWDPLNNSNTLSQGNLTSTTTDASNNQACSGTFGFTSGKWYFEIKVAAKHSNGYPLIGIAETNKGTGNNTGQTNAFSYYTATGTTKSGTSYTAASAGDIIGVAVDADNGRIYYALNNTWQNSGDPTNSAATGAEQTWTAGEKTFVPWISEHNNSKSHANFGQHAFKYTAPTGYKVLCTQNLDDTFSGEAAGTVNNPSKFFDVKLFTGGVAQTIPFGFSPNFVWHKERNNSQYHILVDSARGEGTSSQGLLKIYSNNTENEHSSFGEESNKITFNGDGVQFHGTTHVNSNGDTFVLWGWDAGTAALSSYDSADITPDAQWVNTKSGFSVTKYEGTGGDKTVPHALNAKPDLVIIKNRANSTGSWVTKHSSHTSGEVQFLDNSNTQGSSSYGEIADLSSATTVTLDDTGNDGVNVNKDGDFYVMYAWTGIPGYSKFGTYEGNADDDGPFIYTGHTPKLIIMKGVDSSKDWIMIDSERDVDNVTVNKLYANSDSSESTSANGQIDILSNGFKLRKSHAMNNAAETFIYAAFAEHPFKTARAR